MSANDVQRRKSANRRSGLHSERKNNCREFGLQNYLLDQFLSIAFFSPVIEADKLQWDNMRRIGTDGSERCMNEMQSFAERSIVTDWVGLRAERGN